VSDPWSVVLGSGAALAVVLAATLVVRLHTLPTGADPVREGVSAYGAGPFHRLYQAQVGATGIGSLLLAAGLLVDAPAIESRAGIVGLTGLVTFGLARLAITRYPTDLHGPPLTHAGRLHVLLASLAFVSIGISAPALGRALGQAPAWSGMAAPLATLGFGVSIAVLATFAAGVLPGLRRYFGAIERLVYLTALSWLFVAAVGLIVTGGLVASPA
jgi:hypothetical protein